MKMTKKLFVVAIATAAFALTSCGMLGGGAFDKNEEKKQGTKKNLTISYKNNGECALYKRQWRQLGNKETVQALETVISIDRTNNESVASTDDAMTAADATWYADNTHTNTKNVRAVIGLIFDLHETKAEGNKKFYDFVLIGYRPYDDGIYVERYSNVPEDAFAAATNDSSFSDANGIDVEYLPATDGSVTSATTYYINGDPVEETTGKLGKDDDGKEYADAVKLKKFTVKITQEVKGTYEINVLGKTFKYTPEVPADETVAKKWYTQSLKEEKAGYRIGGAGYYVNVPVGTEIKANFNSNNANTIGLEEEVDE